MPSPWPFNQPTIAENLANFTFTFAQGGVGIAGNSDGGGITPTGTVMFRYLAAAVTTSLTFARTGTASASDATTMTTAGHTGSAWAVNEFAGAVVTMGGSTATIISNTATVLTFAAWSPISPVTGTYSIAYDGTGTTLALGLTGATTAFIAATNATLLTADKIWSTTTPNATGILVPATATNFVRARADVSIPIVTTAVHDITGGVISGSICWTPVTAGATLVGV